MIKRPLPDKERSEPTARHLNAWLRDAERLTGASQQWLSWQLASTVVLAALQRALGSDHSPLFLVKGGVYLELALGQQARATKDLDALFRGTVDEFATTLGQVVTPPWGPFELEHTPVEEIAGAQRLVKPRRFEVRLKLRGVTWRSIKVEVSFPEGRIAEHASPVPAPSTGFYGISTPDHVVGIALDYQVAQKLHAASDPDKVDWTNDRVRDVIDLTMLRRHFYPEVGVDQHSEVRPDAMLVSLRAACLDLFDSRAAEAETLGVLVRRWPPTITPNDVWYDLYPDLAASVGLNLTLEDAVAGVHDWIERISVAVDIDTAPSPQL